MKKISCLASISLTLTACSPIDSLKPFDSEQADTLLREHATTTPAQQRIALRLPQKNTWKAIDLSRNKQGSPIMLIPRDATTKDWHESVRTFISPYRANPDMTAKLLWQDNIKEIQARCAEVKSDLIAATRETVFYSLSQKNCRDDKDLVMYGKSFNGSDAVYLVYYTADPVFISGSEIARMAKSIKDAALVKDPRTNHP